MTASELMYDIKLIASKDALESFNRTLDVLQPKSKKANDLILLKRRWNTLDKNYRLGLLKLTTSDFEGRRTKMVDSFLQLADEIEESDIRPEKLVDDPCQKKPDS